MKVDNKDLGIGILLIIPGAGFMLTLGTRVNEHRDAVQAFICNPTVRLCMGLGCVIIAGICAGLLAVRLTRKS